MFKNIQLQYTPIYSIDYLKQQETIEKDAVVFIEDRAIFSNFTMCPTKIKFNDFEFYSVEHFYQAAKLLDPIVIKNIAEGNIIQGKNKYGIFPHTYNLKIPAHVKLYVRYNCIINKEWDSMRYNIMRYGLYEKFSKNETFLEVLLNYRHHQLIENAPWGDTIWGICFRKGANGLGKILKEIQIVLDTNNKAIFDYYCGGNMYYNVSANGKTYQFSIKEMDQIT